MSHNVYKVESSLTSCKAYFLPTIKPRQRHHGITLLISIVIKIFCIRTLCAWVFFSTLPPWEFNYAKLRNLHAISKRGLVVKFARLTGYYSS